MPVIEFRIQESEYKQVLDSDSCLFRISQLEFHAARYDKQISSKQL